MFFGLFRSLWSILCLYFTQSASEFFGSEQRPLISLLFLSAHQSLEGSIYTSFEYTNRFNLNQTSQSVNTPKGALRNICETFDQCQTKLINMQPICSKGVCLMIAEMALLSYRHVLIGAFKSNLA